MWVCFWVCEVGVVDVWVMVYRDWAGLSNRIDTGLIVGGVRI